MKQQIENIIKKNLPEKKELKNKNSDNEYVEFLEFRKGFNQALSQINTSLIADEVLKVVRPKLESIYKNLCLYHCAEHKLLKKEIKDLLSNLSPNKENKNNG